MISFPHARKQSLVNSILSSNFPLSFLCHEESRHLISFLTTFFFQVYFTRMTFINSNSSCCLPDDCIKKKKAHRTQGNII